MPRKTNAELPLDIYIPFVQSLFRDSVTLAVGISAQSFLAFLVYLKTADVIYLGIALAIVAIGAMRLASTRKVLSHELPPTRQDARRLENVYIFWGTLHAGSL